MLTTNAKLATNHSIPYTQINPYNTSHHQPTTHPKLYVTRTREAITRRIEVNRLPRNIQPQPTHTPPNQYNKHINHRKTDLPRRAKPLAPVNMQPVDPAKTVTEPAREQ